MALLHFTVYYTLCHLCHCIYFQRQQQQQKTVRMVQGSLFGPIQVITSHFRSFFTLKTQNWKEILFKGFLPHMAFDFVLRHTERKNTLQNLLKFYFHGPQQANVLCKAIKVTVSLGIFLHVRTNEPKKEKIWNMKIDKNHC